MISTDSESGRQQQGRGHRQVSEPILPIGLETTCKAYTGSTGALTSETGIKSCEERQLHSSKYECTQKLCKIAYCHIAKLLDKK